MRWGAGITEQIQRWPAPTSLGKLSKLVSLQLYQDIAYYDSTWSMSFEDMWRIPAAHQVICGTCWEVSL